MSIGRKCLLACGVVLIACGEPHQAEPNIAPGKAQVALGYLHEGEFSACETGSDAHVIWGAQGGTWVMPVLRTRGVASPTRVEASLTLTDGERLGEFEFTYELSMTSDEWLETELFRIPVQHAPPDQFESIADVYGQSAVVEVRISDDEERSADLSLTITLVEEANAR